MWWLYFWHLQPRCHRRPSPTRKTLDGWGQLPLCAACIADRRHHRHRGGQPGDGSPGSGGDAGIAAVLAAGPLIYLLGSALYKRVVYGRARIRICSVPWRWSCWRGLAAQPPAGRRLADQCGTAGRGVDGYAVGSCAAAGVIRCVSKAPSRHRAQALSSRLTPTSTPLHKKCWQVRPARRPSLQACPPCSCCGQCLAGHRHCRREPAMPSP